jgi:hypothetical protein
MTEKNTKHVCPRKLSKEAKRFWKWADDFFTVPEEKLNLLEGTAINWGLFKQCEQTLTEEGFTTQSARGFKARPEIQVMKNAWSGFCLGVKLLGILDDDEGEKKSSGGQTDDRWKRPRGPGGVVTWGK